MDDRRDTKSGRYAPFPASGLQAYPDMAYQELSVNHECKTPALDSSLNVTNSIHDPVRRLWHGFHLEMSYCGAS